MTNVDTTRSAIQAQDMLPVRSRIAWGAILAGAVLSLAVFMLLGTLGAAIGFSVGSRFEPSQVGTGTGIWAVVSALISLFVGGWVTSQCSVGETKLEAVFYGLVLWGVIFTILMYLTVSGIGMGLSGIMGVAHTVTPHVDSAQLTANLNLSEEQLRRLQENVRGATQGGGASRAAWWTFAGMALSMLTAVVGALAGSGPRLSLLRGGAGRAGVAVAAAPVDR